MKRGFNVFAKKKKKKKRFNLDQPVQPAESDLSHTVLVLVNFLHVIGLVSVPHSVGC